MVGKKIGTFNSKRILSTDFSDLYFRLYYFNSSYIISTAKGDGIELFSWFEIPAIVSEVEEEQADLIGLLHKILAIGFALLVVLHVMAILKHHFIDKDKTLKRMLGSFNKKSNQYP